MCMLKYTKKSIVILSILLISSYSIFVLLHFKNCIIHLFSSPSNFHILYLNCINILTSHAESRGSSQTYFDATTMIKIHQEIGMRSKFLISCYPFIIFWDILIQNQQNWTEKWEIVASNARPRYHVQVVEFVFSCWIPILFNRNVLR